MYTVDTFRKRTFASRLVTADKGTLEFNCGQGYASVSTKKAPAIKIHV